MTQLELLFRVGVKGKSIPESLERFRFEDKSIQKIIDKMIREDEDYLASLLSCYTYEDIMSPSYEDLMTDMIEDFFIEYRDECEQEEIDNVKVFIQLLGRLCDYDVSDIEVDFENNLIIVQ